MTQFLHWHSSHPEEGQFSSKFYDSLSTTHGTILVFFGIVPVAFAALGNLCMPLERHARGALALLDTLGLLLFYVGVISLLASALAPLGIFWITALISNFAAWLACSLRFIATIIAISKAGWWRLPFFIWSLFLTSVLLFVDLLLLEFAAIMQLADASNGAQGLTASVQLNDVKDTASRLWYHLFWFLGHPEVYVLMLLYVGLLAELLRLCLRKIFPSNGELAP